MRFFTALLSIALMSQPAFAEDIAASDATPKTVQKVVATSPVAKVAAPQEKEGITIIATSYPTLAEGRPGIGYLSITNALKQPITLYGAQAPDTSGMIEIHTHKDDNGALKMIQLQELEIPAESTLNFQETKHHLMLMDMKKELVAGDSYPMTLKFQKEEGSLLPIEVEVSVVER